ncbi:MAG TPA: hypothetical protein VF322_17010 [Gammaproteobacteria bacterium]
MTFALSSVAAAALVAVATAASAQGSRALQQRLSKATRVECKFSTLVTGDWQGASPTAAVTPAELEATFFDINLDEGTAEAGSDFGESFISVRYAEGYLHFLQMSYAGPLRITTVLAQESAGGRLKAVQTRHEYLPTRLPGFTSRPEMYIGDCAVT